MVYCRSLGRRQAAWAALLGGLSLALSGCAGPPEASNRNLATIAGAAVGSKIGGVTGHTVAAIAGAVLGGYLGRSLVTSMEDDDRRRAVKALEGSDAQDQTHWVNPKTGHEYSITPTRTYRASGRLCRDFETETVIDGRRESGAGTACRRADGNWEVVGKG